MDFKKRAYSPKTNTDENFTCVVHPAIIKTNDLQIRQTSTILLVCIGILLVLISCEKEIAIKQQAYTSKPSIQCLITPGQIPKLYLNSTLPYLSPTVSLRQMFVADATVTLESNGITDKLVPDSVFQIFFGTYSYFYKGSKPIQANQKYNLVINSKGVNYSATASTVQQPFKLDSVTYIETFKDIYGEHEGVVFHLKVNPATTNYYRYEMHRMADTTTYWGADKFKSPILKNNETTNVTEIGRTIFSDAGFSGGTFTFAIEPVFSHKKGVAAYVFLQICDKNIFDFYDELDKQMLAQQNPFVEPVFLVSRQFKNAYGVFGSYAVSDSVRFVYPE